MPDVVQSKELLREIFSCPVLVLDHPMPKRKQKGHFARIPMAGRGLLSTFFHCIRSNSDHCWNLGPVFSSGSSNRLMGIGFNGDLAVA